MATEKTYSIGLSNSRRPLNSSDVPPESTVWVGASGRCLVDGSGANSGLWGFTQLELTDETTGQGLGVFKPNISSDPDFIPPVPNPGACPVPSQLSVSPQTLNLGFAEYGFDLSIESNTSWQITNFSPGLSFNKLSGSGDDTVGVVVSINSDTFSVSKSFFVKASDGVTRSVQITQAAFDPSEMDVTPQSLEFEVAGGSQQIVVSTAQTWDFSENLPWLSVTRSGDTLTVNASYNEYGPRIGVITIEGEITTVQVPVNQKAVPVYPVVLMGRGSAVGDFNGADTPDEAMDNPLPKTIYATTEQDDIGVGTRFFMDNVSYTPLEGDSKWYRLGQTTLAVQIDNGGYFLGMMDTSVTLYTSPESLTGIYGEGQTRNLTVYSNTNWSVVSKSSWITVNSGSPGGGNGSLNLTFAPNPGPSSRNGSITLRTSGGERTVAVSVTQGTEFTIDPEEWTAPSHQGGTFELDIVTTGSWTANFLPFQDEDPGSILPESGSGDSTITVNVAPNAREFAALRVVEVLSQNRGRLCEITIPAVPPPPYLDIVPTSKTFGPNSGSTIFEIESNTRWALSRNQNWINPVPDIRNLLRNSGEFVTSSNQTVEVYTLAKTIPNGTQVTLSMKATLERQYFAIFADGGSVYVNEFWPANSTDGVFKKTFTWNAGSATDITVYQQGPGGDSSIEWIYLSETNNHENWVSAQEDSPISGEGDASIRVNIGSNIGPQRTATITVSANGVPNKIFTLTQQSVQLHQVIIYGTGMVVGEYEGADSAWDALDNAVIYDVYSNHQDPQPGTVYYPNSWGGEPLDGKDQWYLQGDYVVQIGQNGWAGAVIPVEDVEEPDPGPDPPSNGITPPALLFPAVGGTENIQITALNNAAWTASTDGLGVRLNDNIGDISGNGNALISVTVPPNPFDQIVIFEVSVNISGSIYICSCTQAPTQN